MKEKLFLIMMIKTDEAGINMKVLAIMGSPRRGKNNDILLDTLLGSISRQEASVDITKLYVSDLAIAPCLACDACTRRSGCVQKDGMENLYRSFDGADIILITSPMYFNSISGQLKAIIDRNQAIWSSKYVLKQSLVDKSKPRVGYVIITAGAEEHPYELQAVTPIMDLFFKSINTEYMDNYFVNGVDERPAYDRAEVLSDIEGLAGEILNYYRGAIKRCKCQYL